MGHDEFVKSSVVTRLNPRAEAWYFRLLPMRWELLPGPVRWLIGQARIERCMQRPLE
jgi:hypothetical protein